MLVRGAGEMATGCIRRLHLSGFLVLALEQDKPTCVRRTVSLAEVVYEKRVTIDGIVGVLVQSPSQVEACLLRKEVPVLIDPEAHSVDSFLPDIVVDARLLKRNVNSSMKLAPRTVGLGPGFTVGDNCHLVIETKRGHDLGRVIDEGSAAADTGRPGEIAGVSTERLLRAPCEGAVNGLAQIGDLVGRGQEVAHVASEPVVAAIDGVLRGLIRDGAVVTEGMKIGDVDPRGERLFCFTISDKANAIAGGVLEAVLRLITS